MTAGEPWWTSWWSMHTACAPETEKVKVQRLQPVAGLTNVAGTAPVFREKDPP